jgi:hypothetical protein
VGRTPPEVGTVGAKPTCVVTPAEDSTPPDRRRRLQTGAASIVVVGLMLFAWPFVRTPLLPIGPSYAHLLGAWAAIVAALALLARAIARSGVRADGRRSGADRA